MSMNGSKQSGQGSPPISCRADDGFRNWMSNYGGSVVFSTLGANRLVILGWDGRQVTVMMREMSNPSGICVLKDQLLVTTHHDIQLFANAPLLAYDYKPEAPGEYDACFLPRTSWHIGDLQARDVLIDKKGFLFLSTRFSCMARPSFRFHFEEEWRPNFVSALVPEDRCHLSGATTVGGTLAYVTALGKSDTSGGWREQKARGGILMDAGNGEILLDGLSLPHSPRWHKECLWFLNSGEGALCVMNPVTREVKTVCRLPGFARGLTFYENYAIVGLSAVRKSCQKGEISIPEKNQLSLAAVAVVSILSGKVEGMFNFESGCEEIGEVSILPGFHRAALLTSDKPACYEAVTTEKFSWWIRP